MLVRPLVRVEVLCREWTPAIDHVPLRVPSRFRGGEHVSHDDGSVQIGIDQALYRACHRNRLPPAGRPMIEDNTLRPFRRQIRAAHGNRGIILLRR
jgi:hypothetical protein